MFLNSLHQQKRIESNPFLVNVHFSILSFGFIVWFFILRIVCTIVACFISCFVFKVSKTGKILLVIYGNWISFTAENQTNVSLANWLEEGKSRLWQWMRKVLKHVVTCSCFCVYHLLTSVGGRKIICYQRSININNLTRKSTTNVSLSNIHLISFLNFIYSMTIDLKFYRQKLLNQYLWTNSTTNTILYESLSQSVKDIELNP